MKTLEEIESLCHASRPVELPRHSLEAPALWLRETFYPMGFPTELRTNFPEVVAQARALWSMFEMRFDTKPIRVDVHVVEGSSADCPPTPVPRIIDPLLVSVADVDNYSIANLEQTKTQMTVSRAAVAQSAYLGYFFLGAAPLCHIASRFTTPIHAGCVAFHGKGLLLCGESGAGKSSLSYACARAGWTYTTDDASYLLNNGKGRLVTGNCHQVRFRPEAAELFPEVEGREVTPRAAGKPSIELPTAALPGMACAPTAQVDSLVFLNRRDPGPPELLPYSKDLARSYLRNVLFGPRETLAVQCAAIERLLTARVFELRYSDLPWAVERLEALARKGR